MSAQNIILDHCLDQGIQISSGAENVVTIIGGQSYGSPYRKRVLWSDNYQINAGIKGLVIIGRYLPLRTDIAAVLDLNIYTGLVELVNCEFDTHGVNLLAPTCTSSNGGPVRVVVRGGACVSGGREAITFNDTHNVGGSVISLAQGVADNATGRLIDKHWAGDFATIALLGNDFAAHQLTANGEWRRSIDDMVTFAMRLQWNGLSRTTQPMVVSGLPFPEGAGAVRTIVRGRGGAAFADVEFDLVGGQLHGFRRSDGSAFPVPTAGDVTISGSYSVRA